jgi:signal peptidase I
MTSNYVKLNRETQSLSSAAITELMKAVLDKKAPFRLTAPGFSMTPFIRNGDVITIAPGRYRFGDVVAFLNPHHSKLTVHRIVHVSREGYLLKGDNAPEPDGRLHGLTLIGRVVRVEHHGRPFKLGLGPERILMAWLSCRGWLAPFLGRLWHCIRPVAKRWVG